jgi:hypothetical protein
MKIIMQIILIFIFSSGCSNIKNYKLSCGDTIKGKKILEKEFIAICPAKCSRGNVWGSKSYTPDSSICSAIRHSGIGSISGGKFRIRIVPGQKKYEGTEQNGVTTGNWGPSEKGFIVFQPSDQWF